VWFTFSNWNVASINGSQITINSAGTDTLTIHCNSKNYGEITASISITATEKKQESDFILGDVTMDGIITGSDATYALIAYTRLSSFLDDGLTDMQFKAADADSDGIITGTDATLILQYYTELSSNINSENFPSMEEWMKKR